MLLAYHRFCFPQTSGACLWINVFFFLLPPLFAVVCEATNIFAKTLGLNCCVTRDSKAHYQQRLRFQVLWHTSEQINSFRGRTKGKWEYIRIPLTFRGGWLHRMEAVPLLKHGLSWFQLVLCEILLIQQYVELGLARLCVHFDSRACTHISCKRTTITTPLKGWIWIDFHNEYHLVLETHSQFFPLRPFIIKTHQVILVFFH